MIGESYFLYILELWLHIQTAKESQTNKTKQTKEQLNRQTTLQSELAKIGQCCVVSQLATPDELNIKVHTVNLSKAKNNKFNSIGAFMPNTGSNYLDYTHMSEFVIGNSYEWGFLFFRALQMNIEYRSEFKSQDDLTDITTNDTQEVLAYWGDVYNYILEYDYENYADFFEVWCKENLHKHEYSRLPYIELLADNTVFKSTNQLILNSHKSKEITDAYVKLLNEAIDKINEKKLAKLVPFCRLAKGSIEQQYRYERWLDVAMLTDCLGLMDGSYNKQEVLDEIARSNKSCWKDFNTRYKQARKLFSIPPSKTDTKEFTDIIEKYLVQGYHFIRNTKKGIIKGGRNNK